MTWTVGHCGEWAIVLPRWKLLSRDVGVGQLDKVAFLVGQFFNKIQHLKLKLKIIQNFGRFKKKA